MMGRHIVFLSMAARESRAMVNRSATCDHRPTVAIAGRHLGDRGR
jgi:hypothetical protein